MNREKKQNHRGVALIYTLVIMVAICMLLSLAVDYGRAQLVKTELRRAADAAARAAAPFIFTDLNAANAAAVDVASRNKADGTAVNLVAASDIQYGRWDGNTKIFTPTSNGSLINAVRVFARRTTARGTAVPMMFARVLGRSFCDVQAETIVMVIPPVNVDQNVPATANPFLAGMPNGARASAINPHNNPDTAGTSGTPRQSPLAIAMGISEGDILNFDNISGTARHDPSLDYFNPDGELSDIGHNNLTNSNSNSYTSTYYNENGIADMKGPINALVGIFMDDKSPTMSTTPSNLDFSSATSRNFDTLKPELKQIFFIGDGLNGTNGHQNFVAPKGATRLFLATWDFYEWNNNAGFRNVKVSRPTKIVMVK